MVWKWWLLSIGRSTHVCAILENPKSEIELKKLIRRTFKVAESHLCSSVIDNDMRTIFFLANLYFQWHLNSMPYWAVHKVRQHFFAIFYIPFPTFIYQSIITFSSMFDPSPHPPKKCWRTLWTAPLYLEKKDDWHQMSIDDVDDKLIANMPISC